MSVIILFSGAPILIVHRSIFQSGCNHCYWSRLAYSTDLAGNILSTIHRTAHVFLHDISGEVRSAGI